VVRLEAGGARIVTAGEGGWLRVWDTASLADAEPGEGVHTAEVAPLAQVSWPLAAAWALAAR
jgi:hypothetical protein